MSAIVAAPSPAQGPLASGKSLRRLAQVEIALPHVSPWTTEAKAAGSDLAFQGDLLVAGAYEGFGLFRILDKAPYVEQLSFFDCPGTQGDVSIWGDYVFISMEHQSAFYTRVTNEKVSPTCNAEGSAGQEGIRIVDISDPRAPKQVKFVPITCGSHNHTLIPDGDKMYIYNSALPLYQIDDYVQYCNRLSIVEFPIDDPTQAAIASEPSMDLEIGCHDVTVFPKLDLAAGACWMDSYLWDISNPAEPKTVSKLPSDWVEGHHAAAFTWDGRYLAVGQESGDCTGKEGEIVFYDIRDPKKPKKVGRFHLPRAVTGSFCWSHNFATVPTKDKSRYVLTAGFYNGGVSVIDFSKPARAKEIGYAALSQNGVLPEPWGAYWYNGRIYTNDWTSGLGVGVYKMKGLGAAAGKRFRGRFNPQLQTLGN